MTWKIWLIIGTTLLVAAVIAFVVSKSVRKQAKVPTPEYLKRYLDHVFSACLQSGTSEPYIQTIAQKFATDPATVSWGELFTVESDPLANEPLPVLRRRAWSIRDKFREVVGQRQYDTYLLSAPPNENKLEREGDVELLRSDLGRLLGALHWSYALIPVRERIRAEIIRYVSAQIVVWVLAAMSLALICATYDQTFLATTLFVLLAGALGGFLSLLRRIQLTPTTGDPLLSIFELENGRVSLYLAPLSGAIFSLVLFFIFQAGLVQGAIFPTLDDTPMRLKIYSFWWDGDDPPFTAYALLLVWSFIAGFAERLVPDTLARLVQRSEEASSETRTPPPAGQQSATGGQPTAPTSPPTGNVRGGGVPSPPRHAPTSPPFRV